MERLVADTAERADATRATLEQQVAARTVELSEARDRAEREARLKSVFLAAMSHEIRTPMNSIVGMAELMAETPLDGEQREYCDTIRTSTDALLDVINDILDFSKFEAQGVSLDRSTSTCVSSSRTPWSCSRSRPRPPASTWRR